MALNGDNILIGAVGDDTGGTFAGEAYLFDATTGNLLRTFSDPTPTPHDQFGFSLALDGNNVLIGARLDDTNGLNVGQAYLFDATTGDLLQTFDDPTVTKSDFFGDSVALDGNNVPIGAQGDDTNGDDVGQAYLFDAITGDLLATIDIPLATGRDKFGRSVAIDGADILIGAPGNDTQGHNVGQAYLYSGAPVSVPEPPTLSMFLIGLVGLVGLGIWRRRSDRAATGQQA